MRVMMRRQYRQRRSHERDGSRVRLQAEGSEDVLQKIDADARPVSVQHQRGDTVRRQHVGERSGALGRIGQVMQDAAAYDHVERAAEPAGGAQVQPVQRQVCQAVFRFQDVLVREARLRQVDADHLRVRVGVGKRGGLVGAAAGRQNAQALARPAFRP